jgi:hypothetical protein
MSSDGRYGHAVELIKSGKLDEALALSDKAKAIDVRSEGKFTVRDGVIQIDGEELPKTLSSKLLELVEAGESTDYLEKFWDNLRLNPSKESKEDLFSFLQANKVPITRDGCFITYKKVLDNYWDSYTGRTHLNTVGKTITVDRASVDANRNQTCSHGLHVAAFEYASGFTGTRLLECKVNPRDVVAVPPDYSNQKMRVCSYKILRETTVKYEEGLYKDEAEKNVEGEESQNEILIVNRDSERRIRIPGHMLRKLKVGVGRRVALFFLTDQSGLRLFKGTRGDKPDHSYDAHTDNSIRISNSVLEAAGLSGDSFSVEEEENSVIPSLLLRRI